MIAEPFALRRVRLVGGPSEPVDIVVENGRIRVAPGGGLPGVDLDGRYLLRGLWDHHVHFDQWSLARRRLDLTTATSAKAVTGAVAEHLAATTLADGEVVVGYGFRDGTWTDLPTRSALDSVSADVPVFLSSNDLHCYWMNSAGFRRAGVEPTEDGVLREDATEPVRRTLVDLLPGDLDAWTRDSAIAAAARGVVGVVDLEMADNIASWQRRSAAGDRRLRVECGVYTDRLDAVLDRGLRSGDAIEGTGGLVTMGPYKVITDGSLNTRTAYCYDPYDALVGQRDERGVLVVPPDELEPHMRRAHRGGLTCAIHAIGDHANTLALDAFEHVGATGAIEHAQLVAPKDFPRFAELGVIASVQPEHATDDRDVADRHWCGRTEHAFPYGELLRAGATLRLGSDAPVAPLDPWSAMASAVHRSGDDREPWHPEQQISVRDALDASTRGRATPADGDVADLVVVDDDPLRVTAKELRTMPVHATLLCGRWTHGPYGD